MNTGINFVFFGTPKVASDTLDILKQNGYMPSLVITAPDKPQGRKMLMTPPPVKVWAIQNNVPYIQPTDPRELKITQPDISIVVAYGKIMPDELLQLPRIGSINIHYSLLPKYRGASPVESAILNGETETGVTIQKMHFKMDAGPVLAEEKTTILPDEKAEELRKRLIDIGGKLLVKILPDFIAGKITPTEQNENEATFCHKIKKEDGLIDLSGNASENYNKFRAYSDWPRIFFFQNKKRIIITDAVLENGQFVIKKVLPEGKKEIRWEDFIKTKPKIT